jgi:hypothetical protein
MLLEEVMHCKKDVCFDYIPSCFEKKSNKIVRSRGFIPCQIFDHRINFFLCEFLLKV